MFLNQAFGSHPKIRCVFMHHEQACAMAAEAYARVSGRPAVVLVTTGPGSINAMNGVYGSFTDSIPMIVISGQIKRETCASFHSSMKLRQLGDQEAPTIEMAAPICKYSRLVTTEEELEELLPTAFVMSSSGRPGPVWLDIPLDIQQSTLPIDIPDPSISTNPNYGMEDAIKDVISQLRQSHRPLILAGTGVRLSNTQDRLIKLIEGTGIPLATAWTHDIIASDHPLFAGRPGTIGTRSGNFCLQNSDFVLVLGSRLNIRQTSYNWDKFAKDAFVAQVDIDAAELNKPTIKPDLGICADLSDFLNTLEREIATTPLPNFEPWGNWCQSIQKRYNISNEHQQLTNQPLNPYLMVERVFNALRSDDIVVTGNASACILPFQIGVLQEGQRLFSNSGSASMGYDLPASIGAAAAAENDSRRVICFAGDGSIQMNIQELQTLKTLNANIVIIILNNSGYLSIWQTHDNFFGRIIGATPESGVEFPDFSEVAKAYGIDAVTISNVSELTTLDEYVCRDGPVLIDLKVDPKQEFSPRIKSRVDTAGAFITPELDDMHPFLPESERDTVRAEARKIRAIPCHA